MKIPKDFLLLLGRRRFLSLLVEEKTVAKRKGKQMYRVVNIIRRHWLVRLESFRHKSIGSRSDPALIQLLYPSSRRHTAIHLFMDRRRRWWEWNSYLLLFCWHLTETSHPICPHVKCLEEDGKTTKKIYTRSKSHHHFLSCIFIGTTSGFQCFENKRQKKIQLHFKVLCQRWGKVVLIRQQSLK